MNCKTGNINEIKSLRKALVVLDLFISHKELSVTEVSNLTNIYKSNAFSILSTFTAMGYLKKDETTDKYSLGIGAYRLGRSTAGMFFSESNVVPILQELSDIVSESVVLSVPMNGEVVYIAGTYPNIPNFNGRPYFVGSKAPMYCTSSGKAMLAFMTEEERKSILSGDLVKMTEFTITDINELEKQFELIRKNGYATDHMECVMNLSCVAAPLLDSNGKITYSLSITGPSLRIEENTRNYIHALLKAKEKLTKVLNRC